MGKKFILVSLIAILIICGSLGYMWAKKSSESSGVTQGNPTSGSSPNSLDEDADQAPSLSLTGLADQSTVSGTVTVQANVAGDTSVTKVEFLVDDIFMSVTYNQPFEYTLDTTKLDSGIHTLRVKVYGDEEKVISEKTVSFTVSAPSSTESNQLESPPRNSPSSPAVARQKQSVTRPLTSSTAPLPTPTPGGSQSPAPTTPPDSTPPATPSNLTISATSPYVVNVDWNDVTSDTAGYRVYRDSTLVATTPSSTYIDKTVVPGNEYTYAVVAYDASNNASPDTQAAVTLDATSVWMDFDRPKNSYNDSTGLELGTKIKPLVNGTMTGVRFYKPLGAVSTHTAKLWDTAGNEIAQGTSTTESSSGWQEVQFDSSVAVIKDTEYTVSYSASDGNYVATGDYFTSAGIKSQYLEAPAGSTGNKNGVYSTTPGNRPTTATETNYWVDGLFSPAKNSGGPVVQQPTDMMTFDGYPDSSDTGVIGKRLPVRDRAPDIAEAGMTISGVDLQIPYWNISKNNTTLQDVKVTYTGGFDVGNHLVYISAGVTGTEIYDSEFDGNDAIQRTIQGINGITVKRSNLHHTGDAIEVAENMLIEDNFIHHIRAPENVNWHPDGVQSSSSTMNNTIRHNTILLTGPSTGAINICGLAGDTISNVLIENNLMGGGGYTVYAGAGTNVNYRILNNKFSTRYYPKVGDHNIYYDSFMGGVIVNGNTLYETGAPADQNI